MGTHYKGLVAGPLDDLRRWPAQGPGGMASLGHRTCLGGRWDEIGDLGWNFLLNHGLRPETFLLDNGCGSLRPG